MSLLAYCMNILVSLMMVSMIFVMLTMSEASMERIALVLDEQITLKNPENPDYDIPDGAVKFDHVTFSYSGTAFPCVPLAPFPILNQRASFGRRIL